MSYIKEKFDLKKPIPTILPKSWSSEMTYDDILIFDNLDKFIHTVSKLTQAEDEKCGISYQSALTKMVKRQTDFSVKDQASIKNLVRENLFKRGLITEEVYENFKYSSDGTQLGVDVGKYASGDSECVITPSRQYIDFFYELYVNISYPYHVSNSDVRNNVAKLLATIEELERKHIFIKVNIVLPMNSVAHHKTDGAHKNFFSLIPLFSHKDAKSVDVMSSIVNDRLLRKFFFAIVEDIYEHELSGSYGYVVRLDNTMCIGDDFNEVELFETIVNEVGA